jgi:hypothetical protein
VQAIENLGLPELRGVGLRPTNEKHEEDTNMKKSIIAGLTFCVAMGAGYAHAQYTKRMPLHKQPIRRPEAVRPQFPPTQFRIPAQPLVRDCVHVVFPQCDRGLDGLNDGTFW